MAHETLIGFGNAAGVTFGSTFTGRTGISGVAPDGTTTAEADFNAPLKAGTLSKLRVFITASGASATGVFTSRINAGAGLQTVTQTAGVNGEYEDATNSDSITDGQLIDIQDVATAGNNTLSMGSMMYAATTTYTSSYGAGQAATTDTAVTGNSFQRGQGTSSAGALPSAEADAQITIRSAGTISNLRASVSTNGAGNPTTVITVRIGGVSQTGTVSFTAGTTGTQTDATHSDSVASGNLLCYLCASGGVSRTVTYRLCAVLFVSSGTNWDSNAGGTPASNNGTITTPAYNTIFGHIATGAQSTEANAQARFRFGTSVSNFRIYLTSNSTTVTAKFRDNGGDGQGVATSTASGTGWFEDATHSDSVATGDLINFDHIGTTANYAMSDAGFTFNPPNVNITAPKASATGSAGTVVPEIDIAAAGANATGSPGTVTPTFPEPLTGAAATGSAGTVAVTGSTGAVGVAATGAAGTLSLEIDTSPSVVGAAATGAANPSVPGIAVGVTGVHASGLPGTPTVHTPSPPSFPVISMMRNRAVAAVCPMDEEAIAAISRGLPSGPIPMGVAVPITGVFATAARIQVSPWFGVLQPAPAVSTQSAANNVAVTIT